MNWRARILQAWLGWGLSRPRRVLWLAFALALASVLFTALRLDFQTSQLDLISPHHPLVKLTRQFKPLRAKDTFTVVIEAPTPHRAVAFLQEGVRRLQDDPTHFQDVLYRVEPGLIQPWALLYLDEADIQRLQERIEAYPTLIHGLIQRPELLNFLQLVNQEMASRMVGELFTGFLKEPAEGGSTKKQPMDLAFLIQTLDNLASTLRGHPVYDSPWSSFFQAEAWERELGGYFWVAEKRYLLFFVTPVREKETFNRTQASLVYLRQVLQEARASFADVQVGVTGQDALKTDEMTVALRDMSWATWISIAGIWLLMALFFRSEGRTLARMLSMVVGLCWTFGWATLFIGHLNILSMVFAPMLVGIGVDFGIHWFARLEEEEQDPSLSPHDAILRVAVRSGPGIITAGVSAALSFLPFVLTGFQGLVELGLISAAGILLHLLADLTVLPLLSLFFKGRRRPSHQPTAAATTDLVRLNRRTSTWILVGTSILCGLSLWSALTVGFDFNPLHLQATGTESVVWAERLRQNSNRSVIFASLLTSSAEEAHNKTAALEALPSVWKVQSLFTMLPEHQEHKISLLHAALASLPAVQPVSSDSQPPAPHEVIDILERIRFKMDEEQAGRWGAQRPLAEQMIRVRTLTGEIIESLHGEPVNVSKALGEYQKLFQEDLLDMFDLLAQGSQVSPMRVTDLPSALQERFLLQDQYLIRIYPSENIWEREPRERFVRELRSVAPQVVGDAVTLHEFMDALHRANMEAAIYAIVAIFVLLWLTFREWRLALLALLPLVAGTLLTVGTMGLVGIQFNPANSIFLPLTVGAGIEYGVIILHRWQEGGMRPGHLPLSTGKGVILASLTTTVGFGSLIICRHRGVFSLGFLSFVGSLFVLAAALWLLPAVLALLAPPPNAADKEE